MEEYFLNFHYPCWDRFKVDVIFFYKTLIIVTCNNVYNTYRDGFRGLIQMYSQAILLCEVLRLRKCFVNFVYVGKGTGNVVNYSY